MTQGNKTRDKIGIGLSDNGKEISARKTLFSSGVLNPTMGLKSSLTYIKNQPNHQAKTNMKNETNNHTIQPKLNTKLIIHKIPFTEGNSMTAVRKIDKLLQEVSASSSPKPRHSVQINKIGHNVQEKKMIDDMTKLIQMKQQRQIRKASLASKISPGIEMTARENTIGMTQKATDMNAQAKLQAAQNHQQSLALKSEQNNG